MNRPGMYWRPSANVLFASSSHESLAACGSARSSIATSAVQAASASASATAPRLCAVRAIAIAASATASGTTGMA